MNRAIVCDRLIEEFVALLYELDRHGLHAHECPACLHVWKHDGTNAGNADAHCCPSCAFGPVWERSES